MISNIAITFMILGIVFAFILFGGFIFYTKKKIGVSVKPLIVGSIGFIVFTQILEKVLHFFVLSKFPNYADHPWFFGIYGGIAAGVFEEVGRYLLFVWLLKSYRDYKAGLSFGVGWGGIEAVIIALTVTLPNIIFAFMINTGTFETAMAGQIPSDQILMIKDTLLNQQISVSLLGMIERIFAVFIQIALSLFILLSVVKQKFSYIIYAIFIHAIIDFPLVFFQTGHITNLWIIEIYIAIIGLLSILSIKKMKMALQ